MLYFILGFITLAIATPAAGIFAFKETHNRMNDIYRAEINAKIAIYVVGLTPYWVSVVCIFAFPAQTYMFLFGRLFIFAFPFFLMVIPLGFVIYRTFCKDVR